MAQTDVSPSGGDQQPMRSAEKSAQKSVDRTLDAERRSFQDADAMARNTSEAATAAATGAFSASAQAARETAETNRRATREITDGWRSTLEPFVAAQMDVNRWFDDMWRLASGFTGFSAMRAMRPFAGASLFGLPPIDVKEGAQAYRLSVELPGLAREDIDLSIQNGGLLIRAQKVEETEDVSAAHRISERHYGRMERSFPLPSDVDTGRIEAVCKDGVLKVILPKSAGADARRSPIPIH